MDELLDDVEVRLSFGISNNTHVNRPLVAVQLPFQSILFETSMSEKYYENRIKCDVLNELRVSRVISSRSTIASEYVLGTTGRRADLAIYNGKKTIGIEIKSQHDSLNRLRDQILVYKYCFDNVMLVVDRCHSERVLEDVDECVSVFQIDSSGRMSALRQAIAPANKSKAICLKLLTMSELKKMLGIPIASQVKKNVLLSAATELPDEVVFQRVINAFVETYADTSLRFWRHVGRRKINPDSLSLLSRFVSERKLKSDERQRQVLFWERWNHHAKQTFRGISF